MFPRTPSFCNHHNTLIYYCAGWSVVVQCGVVGTNSWLECLHQWYLVIRNWTGSCESLCFLHTWFERSPVARGDVKGNRNQKVEVHQTKKKKKKATIQHNSYIIPVVPYIVYTIYTVLSVSSSSIRRNNCEKDIVPLSSQTHFCCIRRHSHDQYTLQKGSIKSSTQTNK